MPVLMGREEIMAVLPHRDPFLLVDEVTGMMPGDQITATTYIKEDAFWFKGHFPGFPVVPGVLIIEMLAQAGAICVLSMPEHKGKLGFLAGVDKARFRRKVMPGDVLTLEVKLSRMRGPIGVGKATAYVGKDKAVTAEITFALSDEPFVPLDSTEQAE